MAEERKRLSELPSSTELDGLYTLGVDENNEGVKIPIGKILGGIEESNSDAKEAKNIATQARSYADGALTQAKNAGTDAKEAKENAVAAKTQSQDAYNTANRALEKASEAKGVADTASKNASEAMVDIKLVKASLDQQNKAIGLNTPQLVSSEEAMEQMIANGTAVDGQMYYTIED